MDATSHRSHDKTLWYLLTATRGGPNRARIVRALAERPRNANRLADELGVGYKTVRHHLDTLQEHGVVEAGGDDYGKLYFVTDRVEREWDTFERIAEEIDG
ncbi:ArsR/SmtB family transcription factor [Salinirubrum litoreum]|uniref:ArsR/SmtB family transcription factor n=1 Tax=Salinirubrum litoreum TaxID=1126234 RepID=A0ABD5R8Y8_9EURY|nr:winged helix-turn-helix domain-containing protein [Salinirubrum litoreum]